MPGASRWTCFGTGANPTSNVADAARRVVKRLESWQPFRLLMDHGEVDSQGKILEYDSPHMLLVTWHVEWLEEFQTECVVTFDLKPLGSVVRLTVTQTHPEPIDEKFFEGGRTGWLIILCGL